MCRPSPMHLYPSAPNKAVVPSHGPGFCPVGKVYSMEMEVTHGDKPWAVPPALRMTSLHQPWWSCPSQSTFSSQRSYMRPTCKTAPLWVFSNCGKGTFSVIAVSKPTLLNGALFPEDFLNRDISGNIQHDLQWLSDTNQCG